MEFNLNALPRRILWAAAIMAAVAITTIITVQILTITLTTRPPMLTRWLNGIFVISSQSIFASIALGVSGYALHSTQERASSRVMVASTITPRVGASVPYTPTAPQEETKLPAALQSALAAAANPKRRGQS